MTRVREGDGIEIVVYPVLIGPDGACDRTYDIQGKTVRMELHPPSGDPIIVTPTVAASDKPDVAASMASYQLPGTQTDGRIGRWAILLTVAEDDLTLGTGMLEVVHRSADVGGCK